MGKLYIVIDDSVGDRYRGFFAERVSIVGSGDDTVSVSFLKTTSGLQWHIYNEGNKTVEEFMLDEAGAYKVYHYVCDIGDVFHWMDEVLQDKP